MRIAGYEQKKNQLIGRLGVLTGKQPVYNGAPDFSYDIGDYRVLRDGSVLVLEECLDSDILDELVSEKLVVDPNAIKEIEKAPEKESETPEKANIYVDEEPPVPKQTESRTSPMASPAWNYGAVSEAHVYDNPIVIKDRRITIHAMVNMVNMIYSKGTILSSVVGKHKAFWVSEFVIAELPYQRPTSYQGLMNIIKGDERADLVKGIDFKPNAIIFTGFPKTNDYLKRKAYEKLAECMYEHAATKAWIASRRMDAPNEKYTCRNFFNQIGLGGAENREIRKLLMKNLSGNCSYRTQAQRVAEISRRKEATERKKREAQAMQAMTNTDM